MHIEDLNEQLAQLKQIVVLNAKLQKAHLDALVDQGFTREESIQLMCSGNKPINRSKNVIDSEGE